MEIDIFEDKENKVFNRREIKFYVEYEGEAYAKVYETVEDLEYIETKSVIAKNTEASEEAEEDEE